MAKTVKFGIEVLGADKIAAALKNPTLLMDPLRGLFEDAKVIAEDAATEGLDGGTGIAVRSIKSYVNPMNMRTVTLMAKARAMSIEKGRRGGESPPLFALVNWLTGTVSARSRDASMSAANMKTAVVIASAIRRRGVKGRFFMRAAQDAVRSATPRLFGDMRRKIESTWKAKT